MTDKKRNAQAVAAWSRHGGPHDPPGKPDEEWKWVIEGYMEIDGETLVIEMDWDDEDDEEDDDVG